MIPCEHKMNSNQISGYIVIVWIESNMRSVGICPSYSLKQSSHDYASHTLETGYILTFPLIGVSGRWWFIKKSLRSYIVSAWSCNIMKCEFLITFTNVYFVSDGEFSRPSRSSVGKYIYETTYLSVVFPIVALYIRLLRACAPRKLSVDQSIHACWWVAAQPEGV